MGLDYSYTQPSESEDYGGLEGDSGFSETEALIRQDQAEIASKTMVAQVQYPPQPEVEFGFPQRCYCGAEPLIATSYTRNDPGRRYYTCEHVDDGECHVWKWWDLAVMELRSRGTHTQQLAQKVDYLAGLSGFDTELAQVKDLHYESEQKIARLEKVVSEFAKNKARSGGSFDIFVGVLVVVLVMIDLMVCFLK